MNVKSFQIFLEHNATIRKITISLYFANKYSNSFDAYGMKWLIYVANS